MKKLLKKKWFWAAVIVLIIVVYFLSQSGKPAKEEVVTESVHKGDLVQTVSATGNVESASETNLNFSATGKLKRLNVKVGDQVKEGQLIAQLDAGQAESAVASARANVVAAQADLDRIRAGSSDEDVQVSESSVESYRVTLESKKVSLANTESDKVQGIINDKEELLQEISKAFFEGQDSLNFVEELLNASYKEDLGNIRKETFYATDFNFDLAESSFVSLEGTQADFSINSSQTELIGFSAQVIGLLQQINALLDNTYDMLVKTTPTNSLSQTTIDSLKSTAISEQASITASITGVQTDKSALENNILSYDSAIDEARAAVERAAKDLELSQAQLALKKSGPRDFEISFYQAKISSAQANLGSALADLAKYRLTSPLNGVVTKVNYEIGEFVSSAEPVASVIGESNLEIKLDVPESDIAKIKVGDKAKITLDAFGEEVVFDGHITFIDPAETVINDVVYYRVKVTFDVKDEKVKSGMTANVDVQTASRSGVIYIPARAVIEKDGKRIVRVVKPDQTREEREVTTGLRGDDGLIEILTGLSEGETVITFIEESK